MKIKFLKTCMVKGELVEAGDVKDFGKDTNFTLLAMGRAEEYKAPEPEAKPKKDKK